MHHTALPPDALILITSRISAPEQIAGYFEGLEVVEPGVVTRMLDLGGAVYRLDPSGQGQRSPGAW